MDPLSPTVADVFDSQRRNMVLPDLIGGQTALTIVPVEGTFQEMTLDQYEALRSSDPDRYGSRSLYERSTIANVQNRQFESGAPGDEVATFSNYEARQVMTRGMSSFLERGLGMDAATARRVTARGFSESQLDAERDRTQLGLVAGGQEMGQGAELTLDERIGTAFGGPDSISSAVRDTMDIGLTGGQGDFQVIKADPELRRQFVERSLALLGSGQSVEDFMSDDEQFASLVTTAGNTQLDYFAIRDTSVDFSAYNKDANDLGLPFDSLARRQYMFDRAKRDASRAAAAVFNSKLTMEERQAAFRRLDNYIDLVGPDGYRILMNQMQTDFDNTNVDRIQKSIELLPDDQQMALARMGYTAEGLVEAGLVSNIDNDYAFNVHMRRLLLSETGRRTRDAALGAGYYSGLNTVDRAIRDMFLVDLGNDPDAMLMMFAGGTAGIAAGSLTSAPALLAGNLGWNVSRPLAFSIIDGVVAGGLEGALTSSKAQVERGMLGIGDVNIDWGVTLNDSLTYAAMGGLFGGGTYGLGRGIGSSFRAAPRLFTDYLLNPATTATDTALASGVLGSSIARGAKQRRALRDADWATRERLNVYGSLSDRQAVLLNANQIKSQEMLGVLFGEMNLSKDSSATIADMLTAGYAYRNGMSQIELVNLVADIKQNLGPDTEIPADAFDSIIGSIQMARKEAFGDIEDVGFELEKAESQRYMDGLYETRLDDSARLQASYVDRAMEAMDAKADSSFMTSRGVDTLTVNEFNEFLDLKQMLGSAPRDLDSEQILKFIDYIPRLQNEEQAKKAVQLLRKVQSDTELFMGDGSSGISASRIDEVDDLVNGLIDDTQKSLNSKGEYGGEYIEKVNSVRRAVNMLLNDATIDIAGKNGISIVRLNRYLSEFRANIGDEMALRQADLNHPAARAAVEAIYKNKQAEIDVRPDIARSYNLERFLSHRFKDADGVTGQEMFQAVREIGKLRKQVTEAAKATRSAVDEGADTTLINNLSKQAEGFAEELERLEKVLGIKSNQVRAMERIRRSQADAVVFSNMTETEKSEMIAARLTMLTDRVDPESASPGSASRDRDYSKKIFQNSDSFEKIERMWADIALWGQPQQKLFRNDIRLIRGVADFIGSQHVSAKNYSNMGMGLSIESIHERNIRRLVRLDKLRKNLSGRMSSDQLRAFDSELSTLRMTGVMSEMFATDDVAARIKMLKQFVPENKLEQLLGAFDNDVEALMKHLKEYDDELTRIYTPLIEEGLDNGSFRGNSGDFDPRRYLPRSLSGTLDPAAADKFIGDFAGLRREQLLKPDASLSLDLLHALGMIRLTGEARTINGKVTRPFEIPENSPFSEMDADFVRENIIPRGMAALDALESKFGDAPASPRSALAVLREIPRFDRSLDSILRLGDLDEGAMDAGMMRAFMDDLEVDEKVVADNISKGFSGLDEVMDELVSTRNELAKMDPADAEADLDFIEAAIDKRALSLNAALQKYLPDSELKPDLDRLRMSNDEILRHATDDELFATLSPGHGAMLRRFDDLIVQGVIDENVKRFAMAGLVTMPGDKMASARFSTLTVAEREGAFGLHSVNPLDDQPSRGANRYIGLDPIGNIIDEYRRAGVDEGLATLKGASTIVHEMTHLAFSSAPDRIQRIFQGLYEQNLAEGSTFRKLFGAYGLNEKHAMSSVHEFAAHLSELVLLQNSIKRNDLVSAFQQPLLQKIKRFVVELFNSIFRPDRYKGSVAEFIGAENFKSIEDAFGALYSLAETELGNDLTSKFGFDAPTYVDPVPEATFMARGPEAEAAYEKFKAIMGKRLPVADFRLLTDFDNEVQRRTQKEIAARNARRTKAGPLSGSQLDKLVDDVRLKLENEKRILDFLVDPKSNTQLEKVIAPELEKFEQRLRERMADRTFDYSEIEFLLNERIGRDFDLDQSRDSLRERVIDTAVQSKRRELYKGLYAERRKLRHGEEGRDQKIVDLAKEIFNDGKPAAVTKFDAGLSVSDNRWGLIEALREKFLADNPSDALVERFQYALGHLTGEKRVKVTAESLERANSFLQREYQNDLAIRDRHAGVDPETGEMRYPDRYYEVEKPEALRIDKEYPDYSPVLSKHAQSFFDRGWLVNDDGSAMSMAQIESLFNGWMIEANRKVSPGARGSNVARYSDDFMDSKADHYRPEFVDSSIAELERRLGSQWRSFLFNESTNKGAFRLYDRDDSPISSSDAIAMLGGVRKQGGDDLFDPSSGELSSDDLAATSVEALQKMLDEQGIRVQYKTRKKSGRYHLGNVIGTDESDNPVTLAMGVSDVNRTPYAKTGVQDFSEEFAGSDVAERQLNNQFNKIYGTIFQAENSEDPNVRALGSTVKKMLAFHEEMVARVDGEFSTVRFSTRGNKSEAGATDVMTKGYIVDESEAKEIAAKLGLTVNEVMKNTAAPKFSKKSGFPTFSQGGIGNLELLRKYVQDLRNVMGQDADTQFFMTLYRAQNEAVAANEAARAANTIDSIPAVRDARNANLAGQPDAPFDGYSRFTRRELLADAKKYISPIEFARDHVDPSYFGGDEQLFKLMDFWTGVQGGSVARDGSTLTPDQLKEMSATYADTGSRYIPAFKQRQMVAGSVPVATIARAEGRAAELYSEVVGKDMTAVLAAERATYPEMFRRQTDTYLRSAASVETMISQFFQDASGLSRDDAEVLAGDLLRENPRREVTDFEEFEIRQALNLDNPMVGKEMQSPMPGMIDALGEDALRQLLGKASGDARMVVPYDVEVPIARRSSDAPVERLNPTEIRLISVSRQDLERGLARVEAAKASSSELNIIMIQKAVDGMTPAERNRFAAMTNDADRLDFINKADVLSTEDMKVLSARRSQAMSAKDDGFGEVEGGFEDTNPLTDELGEKLGATVGGTREEAVSRMRAQVDAAIKQGGREPVALEQFSFNPNNRITKKGVRLSDAYRIAMGAPSGGTKLSVSASDLLDPAYKAEIENHASGRTMPLEVVANNYLRNQETNIDLGSGVNNTSADQKVKASGNVDSQMRRSLSDTDLFFKNADGSINEQGIAIARMFGENTDTLTSSARYLKGTGTMIQVQSALNRIFGVEGMTMDDLFTQVQSSLTNLLKTASDSGERVDRLRREDAQSVKDYVQNLKTLFLRATDQNVSDNTDGMLVASSKIARDVSFSLLGGKFAMNVLGVEAPGQMLRTLVGLGPVEAAQVFGDQLSYLTNAAGRGLQDNAPYVKKFYADMGIDLDIANDTLEDTLHGLMNARTNSMARFGNSDGGNIADAPVYTLRDRFKSHLDNVKGAAAGRSTTLDSGVDPKRTRPMERVFNTMGAITSMGADSVGIFNFMMPVTNAVRNAASKQVRSLLLKYFDELELLSKIISKVEGIDGYEEATGVLRFGNKDIQVFTEAQIADRLVVSDQMDQVQGELDMLLEKLENTNDPLRREEMDIQARKLETKFNDLEYRFEQTYALSTKQFQGVARAMGIPQGMATYAVDSGLLGYVGPDFAAGRRLQARGRQFLSTEDSRVKTQYPNAAGRIDPETGETLEPGRMPIMSALRGIIDSMNDDRVTRGRSMINTGQKRHSKGRDLSLTEIDRIVEERRQRFVDGRSNSMGMMDEDSLRISVEADNQAVAALQTMMMNYINEFSPENRLTSRISGQNPWVDLIFQLQTYPVAAYNALVGSGRMTRSAAATAAILSTLVGLEFFSRHAQRAVFGNEDAKQDAREQLARLARGDISMADLVEVIAVYGAASPLFGQAGAYVSDLVGTPMLKAAGSDERTFVHTPLSGPALQMLQRVYSTFAAVPAAGGTMIQDGNDEKLRAKLARALTLGADMLTPMNTPIPSLLSSAFGGSGSLSRDMGNLVLAQSEGSKRMHPQYSHPVTETQTNNAFYQVDYSPPDDAPSFGSDLVLPSQDRGLQFYEQAQAEREKLERQRQQGIPAPQSNTGGSMPDSPSEGLADNLRNN